MFNKCGVYLLSLEYLFFVVYNKMFIRNFIFIFDLNKKILLVKEWRKGNIYYW